MIKKTIDYVDYDGNKRSEDYYFHLNKAELIEMEFSTAGGLEKYIDNIVKTQDNAKLLAIFKDLVLKAYGVKSPDGKRFVKSAELSKEFSETEAYPTLFMELASDSKAAADFINGIIPADLRDELDKPENKQLLDNVKNGMI